MVAVPEDKSIFVQILGDYPLIRVLDFLLTFREFDYSLSDIAEESGVAWSTLHLLWPKMEELGLVKFTREVGNAKMYKLNTENKLVNNIIHFANTLVWDYTNEHILNEQQAIVA